MLNASDEKNVPTHFLNITDTDVFLIKFAIVASKQNLN